MSVISDHLRYEIQHQGRKLGKRSQDACVRGYRDRLRNVARSKCPYRLPLARYWRLGWDNAENDRSANSAYGRSV